ncbi:YbfB/YjiJ family MFS transporter [Cronobacter dublinensis]|uniref:YbfB/YjiJ family MFS transporter n=1 Tax=Cronobacter dublinensis TaxID=413497 RepID=UPI000CFE45E0|nr:MFS transporter [Cronobacter dublinensis]
MLSGHKFLALSGFSLIAAAYGLARFSWGLQLPAVIRDIPMSSTLVGALSAASFAAYGVASVIASLCTARTGPRLPSLLAGVFAIIGLAILAKASGPLWLLAGVICGGVSSGLVSPPMAEAVKRDVAPAQRPGVNTVINAGTGGGIIVSALAVLLMPGQWREIWLLFAAIAVIPTLMAMRAMPAGASGERVSLRHPVAAVRQPALRPPLVVALLSGVVSAAYWSFGPLMFASLADKPARDITLLWLVTGAAGCFGVLTGAIIGRVGVNSAHRLMQILTLLAFGLLAFSDVLPWLSWGVAALYGFAYITLSGVLLVSGVEAAGQFPAAGLGAVFLLLAIGQMAGSALFGALLDGVGPKMALGIFGALAVVALVLPATRAK